METRERSRTEPENTPRDPAAALPEPEARDRRTSAERLLAAGHAAIEKALSSNSEAFLAQHKQQGGQ